MFDFYDDWEQDEDEWGNDELDRLLSGDESHQPGRHSGMSYGYGSRGGRRKSTAGKDVMGDDPTVVPQSSMFGFLERLPWKIGGRGTRYRPKAATLQDNVGKRGQEAEPLVGEEETGGRSRHGRKRSGTVGSQSTANSLSSRGDLLPSDDEDDAREIDDEFALVLGRMTTGGTSDDHSSKKRSARSRTSTKTTSSKSTGMMKEERRSTSASSQKLNNLASPTDDNVPSITDLKLEEDAVQTTEEAEIAQKRQAAQRLASERGLNSPGGLNSTVGQDPKASSIVETSEASSPIDESHPLKDNSATTPLSPDGRYPSPPSDTPNGSLSQDTNRPSEPT